MGAQFRDIDRSVAREPVLDRVNFILFREAVFLARSVDEHAAGCQSFTAIVGAISVRYLSSNDYYM